MGMSTARPPTAPIALSALLAPITAAVSRQSVLCWVIAEVDGVTNPNGNCFVALVERPAGAADPVARCTGIVWPAHAHLLRTFEAQTGHPLAAGMRVLIRVRTAFHRRHGFSVYIEGIEPGFTVGEAARNLQQIRAALRQEGIADRNRALPAPADFCSVAVISPADAAGLSDFRRHADRLEAAGLCSFRYHTARFQGQGAQAELLQALRTIWTEIRAGAAPDAVALIRGGGSPTDLGWLNAHPLARALCLMPVPVITGIGHATDRTILDEAACLSLDTPSRVSAHIQDAIARAAREGARDLQHILSHSRRLLARSREQVDRAAGTVRLCAGSRLREAAQRLDREREHVADAAIAQVHRARQESDSRLRDVLNLGPRQTLARGFAIVRDAHGRPITRAARMPATGPLTLEFSDDSRTVHPGAYNDPAPARDPA